MPRSAIIAWLLLATISTALPCRGAAPVPRPQSVLEGVAGLDKPVTYTETRIALGELVARVAKDTGFPLTAAKEVADEPVAVAVTRFPARELLEQCADMLDYQWHQRQPRERARARGAGDQAGQPRARRPTPVFEIYQDLASKQREIALRRGALTAVRQRLAEEIQRLVAMATLPPPQIERTQRLRSPVNRMLALTLATLPPPLLERIVQGQPVTFSTEPHPGEERMLSGMSGEFRAARPRMGDAWSYGNAEVAAKEREQQRHMEEEWAAASGYRAVLRLDTARFQSHGQIGLQAYAAPLEPKAAPASAYAQAEGTSLAIYVGVGDEAASAAEDTPERRAALAKDPLLGASKRFKRQPKIAAVSDPPPNGSFTTLQELLPDVARSCGLNILADAYAVDRRQLPFPAEEPAPVYLLLDRITRNGYRWERAGDLIRIRSRSWFFARPYAVPPRVLRHWNALLAHGGEPPLEEYVATAAALNDEQLALLPSLLPRGQSLALHEIHAARHALRLYAALAPQQRQELWRGQPIPLALMTPEQRALFLAPWQEQQRQREREQPSAEPPQAPPLGADSGFALTARNRIVVAEKRGSTTHYRYDTEPDQPPPPAPFPPAQGAPAQPRNITRRTLTQVQFRFSYTPDTQLFSQIGVSPRPVGSALERPQSAPRQR